MKYKITTLLLAVAGLFLWSCEDQLDIQKKGNYGGGQRGDQKESENLNEYNYGTDNSSVKSSFSSLYSIIYNANLVIERFSPESEVKKRCMAEAYFFRGWANLYLGALWGTAPLVTHTLGSDEYAQGNSAEGALLAQASADFQSAIDLNALPSKTDKDDNTTGIRITKECAYAFLGKSLLFEGKNAEAATALDEVINSGLYDLYTGDYGDIHKPNTEFCCESVLENNQVDDANTAWSFYTYVSVWCGWRSDKMSWSTLNSEYSDVTSGYGFCNPRKALYDAFKAYDTTGGGNDYRLDQSIKTLDFLVHPLLTEENGGHGSGNYGLFDQLAALRWMKSNIRAFGGDPKNITVMGQSAGAGSVQALVSSPLAESFVRRAIIQSGGGLGGIIAPKSLPDGPKAGAFGDMKGRSTRRNCGTCSARSTAAGDP